MIPLHGIAAAFGAAGLAAFLLPEHRAVVWVALLVAFLGICAWGSIRVGSPILGPCVTRGPATGNTFALSYDDGPGPATPALLDLLRERGVVASFFCVGERVAEQPDIGKRIAAEGHLVGNHSHRHRPSLTFAFADRLRADLERAQDAIEAATGTRPRFYRPPYGVRNHATRAATDALGLRVMGWSTGGRDQRGDVDGILRRIERGLEPGAIVLLHDAGHDPERVLRLTRGVLDAAKKRGLRTVRLDEMGA